MNTIHRAVEHRVRAIVAVVALALAAVVLAACGGSSGGSGGGGGGDDAQALLKQTFSGSHQVKSGKLDLALGIDAPGDPSLKGPVKVALTGPFEGQGSGKLPQFDITANLSAQGQTFQAGLTSTGSKAFVKFGGTSYAVPDQLLTQLEQSYRQQSKTSSSSGQGLGAYGIHPLDWLKSPTVKGEETVGGAATKHISATLDTSRFLDDVNTFLQQADKQGLGSATGGKLPKQLTAKERQQAQSAIKTATVDVWTGKDDKTLRKLAVALDVSDRSGGKTQNAAVTFSLQFSELNQPQTITAPATSRPLSELLGQFSGLLGGAAAGGGSSSGGGSGSAASVDKYTKCLTDAGSDVRKAQKCAALLGR